MLTKLDEDLQFDATKKYAVLINGIGATPLMEQYIFSNDEATPKVLRCGMTSLAKASISARFAF